METFVGTYYDPIDKIWYGPRRKDFYNFDLTIGEVALTQLRKNPQKIIQIMDSTGETLTAGELVNYAVNLARNLLNLNLKPKDVIGLYAQNTTHVATVMLASFLCGTPVNALFPAFNLDNISEIYSNTKPKIIFCDVENYENARNANKNLNLNAGIYLMNGEIAGVKNIKDLLKSEEKCTNIKLPYLDMKGEDTGIILCSSGTTGIPKGVMISHYAMLNKDIYPNITKDSVVFSYSSMYWISALLNLLTSLIHCTTRVITDKPFTPDYFLYLIEHYKITHLMAAGSQVVELILNVEESKIRKTLKCVNTLMCGGAKIPEIVQNKMESILSDNTNRPGFCVAYGMSELSGWFTLNGGPPLEHRPMTEGKLAANDKVRIVDNQGKFLGPNEQGEILVSSPYKFIGYYKNPEATANALKDNWLYTGDIGYFDEYGFLTVCGRTKDVFKSFNFQIYPLHIEEYIMKILGVAECCIVGIPDLIATNLIACVVVRTQDKKGSELTAEVINQYIKDNLPNIYHLKGGVYFVDAIPKTGSGKIQRKHTLDLVYKL